jgi:mutator family transposase
MAKIIRISERFQHFVAELQESFWGDLQVRTQQAAQQFFEALSERQRDRYMVSRRYARSADRQDYRNGYYARDFVTKFGTLRLRVARTRKRGFLPEVVQRFQRRAEDVTLLIREAFLRGISTRQVGRVVTVLTGEAVSAQTVSRITRSLDPGGGAVSSSAVERRLRVFVFGRSEPAHAASGAAQAGAHAGGLRRAPGRHPPSAGLSAQPGREPGRLGRACWKISIGADWKARSCC